MCRGRSSHRAAGRSGCPRGSAPWPGDRPACRPRPPTCGAEFHEPWLLSLCEAAGLGVASALGLADACPRLGLRCQRGILRLQRGIAARLSGIAGLIDAPPLAPQGLLIFFLLAGSGRAGRSARRWAVSQQIAAGDAEGPAAAGPIATRDDAAKRHQAVLTSDVGVVALSSVNDASTV